MRFLRKNAHIFFGNSLLEVLECRKVAQTKRSDAAQKLGLDFFYLEKTDQIAIFWSKKISKIMIWIFFFANQVAVSEIIFHNLETTRFQLSKTLENVEKEFQVMENGRFEVVNQLFVFGEIPLKEQPTVVLIFSCPISNCKILWIPGSSFLKEIVSSKLWFESLKTSKT